MVRETGVVVVVVTAKMPEGGRDVANGCQSWWTEMTEVWLVPVVAVAVVILRGGEHIDGSCGGSSASRDVSSGRALLSPQLPSLLPLLLLTPPSFLFYHHCYCPFHCHCAVCGWTTRAQHIPPKSSRATDSHLEYSKKIVRSSDTLRISKSLAVRIFPPSQNHSYLEYFFEKCKKPSVFNHNWGKTLALRILKKNILVLT